MCIVRVKSVGESIAVASNHYIHVIVVEIQSNGEFDVAGT